MAWCWDLPLYCVANHFTFLKCIKSRYAPPPHTHTNAFSISNHSTDSAPLRDPCSPLNMQENITVGKHTLRVRGLGDFHACKRALVPVLLNSSLATATALPFSGCSGTSCQISTFQKPSQKYDSLEFYGTSEFWYTMRDVLRIGGEYRGATFESAAKVHTVDWPFSLSHLMVVTC